MRVSGSALIAAAALGPLLIGSAIYAHFVVRGVSDNVLQGEAAGWARTLASRLRELQSPPTGALLGSFLEESRAEGLLYVGHLSSAGRVEAGRPITPFERGDLRLGTVNRVGSVVRFAFPARSGRPRGPGPGPGREGLVPGPGPGPGREGPPPTPPPPAVMRPGMGPTDFPPPRPEMPRHRPDGLLVVEFEPRAYADLMSASYRTLAIGSITASAVVLLSLWVWVAMRRRQAMEREADRARHLAALGEMSAVLAHEIRNPLASLKGHAQLLVEGLGGQERPLAKAERVVQEAVRLERITSDLLDFVRQGELDRAPADLAALVRHAVEEVVPPERLRLTLPAAPVTLAVDAPKLRQVLDNLVRNAVQSGDGPVEVALGARGGEVTLTVRDHGPGIAQGQEERIFEPFVTTRVRGTGLGLAIARRIADRHGGSLTARNHPQGGAVFRLTLPAS
jgi:two-component system sensor histidine kinase HydH